MAPAPAPPPPPSPPPLPDSPEEPASPVPLPGPIRPAIVSHRAKARFLERLRSSLKPQGQQPLGRTRSLTSIAAKELAQPTNPDPTPDPNPPASPAKAKSTKRLARTAAALRKSLAPKKQKTRLEPASTSGSGTASDDFEDALEDLQSSLVNLAIAQLETITDRTPDANDLEDF